MNKYLTGQLGLFTLSLGVFVSVALTYLPSVKFELICLDDHEYVYTNPRVVSGLSGDNFLWAVKSCGYACNWHPLTWLSLQADASLLKDKPTALSGGYADDTFCRLSAVMHAHNVILHAANATLLFLLIVLMMRHLSSEKPPVLPIAALFALLWAIHPLRTEVVCWVSERKESLCVFFMLLSMIAYVGGQGRWLRYLLSLLFFALALAAKPVAVTLPVVLIVWDWVMTGKRFGKSIIAVVPFLLLSVGVCELTLMAQVKPLAVGSRYTLIERVVASLSAPAIYLRQTVWPVGLSVFYPTRPPVPWTELCLGVILLFGSLGVCATWLTRKNSRILSMLVFAVAWCLVSLVPMLGIVKVADQPHSDRYTYWVGCGLAAVAALVVARYARAYTRQVTLVMTLAVGVLTVATFPRMSLWKNSLSLYSDAVPKSWADQIVCSLSCLLRAQGDEGARQAEAMLREALSHNDHVEIHAEFAHLLATMGEKSSVFFGDSDPAFAEARYEAKTVLSGAPNHSVANEALAIIEMKEGKWESALKRLELARKDSENAGRVDMELAICRERLSASKKGSDVQE